MTPTAHFECNAFCRVLLRPAGPCLDGEKNLTDIGSGAGAICGAKCGVGQKCPTDVPAGMSAKPSCYHNEGLFAKYVQRALLNPNRTTTKACTPDELAAAAHRVVSW